MPQLYPLIEQASAHCWSNNFLGVFRDFFADHAHVFANAPEKPCEEQNLEYYDLFQRYLRLYESTLSAYIETLDCTLDEFYDQLAAVRDDPSIKDKKLLHFVNYLLACIDYPSFYKVMYRAAKKAAPKLQEMQDAKAEGKDDDDHISSDAKGGESDAKGGGGDSKDYK